MTNKELVKELAYLIVKYNREKENHSVDFDDLETDLKILLDEFEQH